MYLLTHDEKAELAIDLFPLIIQALYNARRMLRMELSGEWWKLPDGSIHSTLIDCDIILDILAKLGIFPPEITEKDIIPHISLEDKDGLLHKYSWRQCQVLKNKRNLEERKEHIKNKINEIVVKYLEKYITQFREKFMKRLKEGIEKLKGIQKYIRAFNSMKQHLERMDAMIDYLPTKEQFSVQERQVKLISKLCKKCLGKIQSVNGFSISDDLKTTPFDSACSMVDDHEDKISQHVHIDLTWDDIY